MQEIHSRGPERAMSLDYIKKKKKKRGALVRGVWRAAGEDRTRMEGMVWCFVAVCEAG